MPFRYWSDAAGRFSPFDDVPVQFRRAAAVRLTDRSRPHPECRTALLELVWLPSGVPVCARVYASDGFRPGRAGDREAGEDRPATARCSRADRGVGTRRFFSKTAFPRDGRAYLSGEGARVES